jgi:hypothetical protein
VTSGSRITKTCDLYNGAIAVNPPPSTCVCVCVCVCVAPMNLCDAIDRPNPRLWDAQSDAKKSNAFQPTSWLPLQSNIYATSGFRDKCHILYPCGDIECFLRNVWSVIHFRARRRLQQYVSTLTFVRIKKKRSCRKNLLLHLSFNITMSTQKPTAFRPMHL